MSEAEFRQIQVRLHQGERQGGDDRRGPAMPVVLTSIRSRLCSAVAFAPAWRLAAMQTGHRQFVQEPG
jgi:hypothetical protein